MRGMQYSVSAVVIICQAVIGVGLAEWENGAFWHSWEPVYRSDACSDTRSLLTPGHSIEALIQ